MPFQFSDAQLAVFDWVANGAGSAVVEAVAGAGKTTTLVESVRRMTGSVFLGAFNNKMGKELKSRTADIKNVKAGTFHSAGFSALRYALKNRLEVDGNKVRDLTRQALYRQPEENEEGWVPAICQLVSLAKLMGFGVSDCVANPTDRDWLCLVHKFDVADRLPEGANNGTLVKYAMEVLGNSNAQRDIIDFDDMIYLPLLLNLKFFKNDWVLIDEAQDTNPTRRALATRMLKRGGRLVAVGDPHQAIYGFSGADSDSLDLIREQFEATTLHLNVSWRCPKAVVLEARKYVSHIEAAPTAPEGEVLSIEYQEMYSLAQPGDAILCRYNRYIVDACFKLIRAGKAAKIEGRSIGEGLAALAGRWKKARTLEALEDRLQEYQDRETEKARVRGDEAKLERLEDQIATLRVLMDRAREQGIETVDALKEMIKGMFADHVSEEKRLITLSSVHRSKGLEWERVFILGRHQLMPSKRAVQPWAIGQEVNLCYVAVTRAKEVLIDVAIPPELL